MPVTKYTVDPPNTAALRTVEKTAILENSGKGSDIYNQEKTYSGLENPQRYGGRRSTEGCYRGGGGGGGDCNRMPGMMHYHQAHNWIYLKLTQTPFRPMATRTLASCAFKKVIVLALTPAIIIKLKPNISLKT